MTAVLTPGTVSHQCAQCELSARPVNLSAFPSRTLLIGGAGSLLLDWYGWESVFYFSGLLTLLWVYCTCKYLLNEKGESRSLWLAVLPRIWEQSNSCPLFLQFLCVSQIMPGFTQRPFAQMCSVAHTVSHPRSPTQKPGFELLQC